MFFLFDIIEILLVFDNNCIFICFICMFLLFIRFLQLLKILVMIKLIMFLLLVCIVSNNCCLLDLLISIDFLKNGICLVILLIVVLRVLILIVILKVFCFKIIGFCLVFLIYFNFIFNCFLCGNNDFLIVILGVNFFI